MLLYGGFGVTKDEKLGLAWIKRAADQRLTVAEYRYAKLLMERGGPWDEVLIYLNRGLEKKYPKAMRALAKLYAAGFGVEAPL
jgi:TPR repeat protein